MRKDNGRGASRILFFFIFAQCIIFRLDRESMIDLQNRGLCRLILVLFIDFKCTYSLLC